MIQIAGRPFQQSSLWPADSIEATIIKKMQADSIVYSYSSIRELMFEIKLRKNIIESARSMSKGQARFTTFAYHRCNPQYWHLTRTGGFRLRAEVKPADAIRDIFKNSSLYAFECATAMLIIYYHAILDSIGEKLFNLFFQNIYLYSWHADPDIGLEIIYTDYFLPGDIVYFRNPDFNPRTSWWRGENAVVLGDDSYFGHGLGIRTAEQIIEALNKYRRPGSTQSAFLTDIVSRPSFTHLARLSMMPQRNLAYKIQPVVIHHNQCSISIRRYIRFLYMAYQP